MSKRDYYDILGIAKTASEDEIKSAYRKLASKYHPDRLAESEKKEGEAKFKEAKEAYETLSDSTKRQHYDRFGHNAHEFSGGHAGHGNWSTHTSNIDELNDVFKAFFSQNVNFNNDLFGQRTRQVTQVVNISLADAYLGKQIKIDSATIINIPKGARSGTKFYVNGKFYRVDVQPHIKFKRANDDLLVDLQITAIEAILGINATLEHLDGTKLQFSIPAGIQPGQIVKLSSKGMKNPENDRYGDLLIRISVLIPRDLSEADKDVLKTLQHREMIDV